ncbi:hypothetical protein HPB51_006113 [Rhipicephalus microplus]|uniref:Uncharacterized protein n=1 Tax=Rhipicephalus microplus TaxID=6941 RepID=A0A9J6ERP8_RHIMP|nr:hypothetical protein HPB51_006113 [Rhipicephalus microplus]
MPLVINGAVVDQLPPDTRTLFETYPHFKEIAAALISQVPKVIGPLGLLYVHQREFAVTVPQDKNVSVLGTDEATTCTMAIIRHTGSGAVSLAHFDGSGLEQGVASMVRRVQELSLPIPEGRFEVYLVGGFLDRRGYSESLANQLLYALHKQPVNLHLVTACVCGEDQRSFLTKPVTLLILRT